MECLIKCYVDSLSLSLSLHKKMLDRESKREKILEGKLREIKIKLKKQNQDTKITDILVLQAELPPEDKEKDQDDLPVEKPEQIKSKFHPLDII